MNLRTTQIIKTNFSMGNVTKYFDPVNGPLATTLAAARRYKQRLIESNQSYQILINELSDIPITDSTLNCAMVNDIPVDPEEAKDYLSSFISQVKDDLLDEVDATLCDAAEAMNTELIGVTNKAFTIVDGEGYSYTLRRIYYQGRIAWVQTNNDIESAEQMITDGIIWFDNGQVYFNNVMHAMGNSGTSIVSKTLPSLLNSLAISSTINMVNETVINLATSGKLTAAAMISELEVYKRSSVDSISKWASTLGSIFSSSGVPGILRYILSRLSDVGHAALDDDGAMIFTDNLNLVPQEFIGTLIGQIFSTTGLILAAVGGIVAKIIGVASAVIGAGISFLSNAFWKNYDSDTLAGVIDAKSDGTVTVIEESPHAILQCEIRSSLFEEVFGNVCGIGVMDVPGGKLHVGASNKDGYYRCEFHPAPFWLYQDLDSTVFHAIPKDSGLAQSLSYIVTNPLQLKYTELMNIWLAGEEYSPEILAVSTKGYTLSDASDLIVRRIVTRNTGFFILFISAILSEFSTTSYKGLRFSETETPYPRVAWQLSVGTQSSWIKRDGFQSFISAALLPHHLYIIPINGVDGQQHTPVVLDTPSWEDIAYMADYCAKHKSFTNLITASAYGNQLKANYSWSQGQYSPMYGDEFLVALVCPGSSQGFDGSDGIEKALSNDLFNSEVDIINTEEISSSIYAPKYNRETYWLWVGLSIAVTAIAATIAVVSSIKIKRKMKINQSARAAQVEQAWNNLTKDPTNKSAAENYYKTVKRVNLRNKIFGGTAYSTSNYWDTGSSDAASTPGKLNSFSMLDAASGNQVSTNDVLRAIIGENV